MKTEDNSNSIPAKDRDNAVPFKIEYGNGVPTLPARPGVAVTLELVNVLLNEEE